jgi:hypothetical protein
VVSSSTDQGRIDGIHWSFSLLVCILSQKRGKIKEKRKRVNLLPSARGIINAERVTNRFLENMIEDSRYKIEYRED